MKSSSTVGGTGSGEAIDLLKRFWTWTRPHIRYVWFVLGLQLIATPLSIIVPLVVQRVVDRAMESTGAFQELLPWGALVLGLAVASSIVGIAAATILIRFRVKVFRDLRLALFRKVLALSSTYHAQHETGYLMSRQVDDVRNLDAVMADGLARVFVLVVRGSAFLAMLFYLQWQLALAGMLVIGFIYAIGRLSSPHLRRLAKDSLEMETALSAATHQGLSGHALIQATAAETREALRFARRLHASIRTNVRRDLNTLYFDHVYHATATAGPALIVVGGVWFVVSSDFTIGGLFAFFLYLGRLLVVATNLAGFNARIQSSLASLKRVFEVLDAKVDVAPPSSGGQRLKIVGAIRFDGVWFEYDPGRPVLRDISLDVPPNSRIALVGQSGAGKSTLASLVPRFFDPTRGRVLVDGVDVRHLHLRRYRQVVGLVPQDVFLFDRTIGENIALGRTDASMDEVKAAALAANAWEFIEAMPEGLDTPVGERGIKLSGGQRQRLAIARELLRNPRVLILDEATSAVDSESEALIQDALEVLLRGRTSIVIAHRLSTIAASDLIVVMDRGKIVERGRHEELLDLDGRYSSLYRTQFDEALVASRR